jgi:hypothetical protein
MLLLPSLKSYLNKYSGLTFLQLFHLEMLSLKGVPASIYTCPISIDPERFQLSSYPSRAFIFSSPDLISNDTPIGSASTLSE